jgi:RimJ/RimL family protein N-acetyltransferase
MGGAPAADRLDLARETVVRAGLENVDIVVLTGEDDPDAAFERADLALAAGGSTCWELCRYGVPMVIVSLAPNQERLGRGLANAGAARFAGPLDRSRLSDVAHTLARVATDLDTRERMAARAVSLVDGMGSRRVVTRMRARLLTLRPVVDEDAPQLLGWANDPETRRGSFRSAVIEADAHRRWLAARLQDDSCMQLIAEHAGQQIGLVRFDEIAESGCRSTAEIGVTVAPAHRGKGWAAPLIDSGCQALRSGSGHAVLEVRARVRPENSRSVRAFQAADFDVHAHDPDVVHLIRRVDGD